MTKLGTNERPLRVAVVGAGPAGFYAAGALLKADIDAKIDLFDRLPVPFGLVRSGVAPDHQKIKNVIRQYDKIARDESVSFWGGVNVGSDISVAELQKYYDALIFSHGSESDRSLGIPGEELAGSRTATEFVGWYNCHPDYLEHKFDLSGKHVVIIGQGNVAMDVGRVLAKPVSVLEKTDIATYALELLKGSQVESISIVGRRGPLHVAFTDKEIKEMGEIEGCDVFVDPKEIALTPAEKTFLESADKGLQRNYSILQEFSEREKTGAKRCIKIRFFRSPVEVIGEGRVGSLKLEINSLEGEPGSQRARGTGEYETMPCDLLFRSIGYRGEGIEGLPFDEKRAVYPNEKGRIETGLYTAGWIKRGPSGVIGTNKPDSVETVDTLLSDIDALKPCENPDSASLRDVLQSRGVQPISYEDWQKIDQLEIERGETKGKPREKFITLDEMRAALA